MDEDLVDSDFINKLKEPVNKLKLVTTRYRHSLARTAKDGIHCDLCGNFTDSHTKECKELDEAPMQVDLALTVEDREGSIRVAVWKDREIIGELRIPVR